MTIALIAAAAAAFAAPASAQVEVTEEATGTHCPSVTVVEHDVTGGCAFIMSSDSQVEWRAIFGVMIMCDAELEVRIDETGKGYAYQQSLTNCSSDMDACFEADGHTAPWRVELSSLGGGLNMEMQFCIDAPLIGVLNCHLTGIAVSPVTHDTATFESETSVGGHKFCESSSTNAFLAHFTSFSDEAHGSLEVSF